MIPNRSTVFTWYACSCGHMESSDIPGEVECSRCGEEEVAGSWWVCGCGTGFRETRDEQDECPACGEVLAERLSSGAMTRYPGGRRIRSPA